MKAETATVDLGSGYEGELRYIDGKLLGVNVTGPAGEQCHRHPEDGRCSGWVPVNGVSPHDWDLVSEDPLTLRPSIRCGCDMKQAGVGQHGYITEGRWVNAGGIVA